MWQMTWISRLRISKTTSIRSQQAQSFPISVISTDLASVSRRNGPGCSASAKMLWIRINCLRYYRAPGCCTHWAGYRAAARRGPSLEEGLPARMCVLQLARESAASEAVSFCRAAVPPAPVCRGGGWVPLARWPVPGERKYGPVSCGRQAPCPQSRSDWLGRALHGLRTGPGPHRIQWLLTAFHRHFAPAHPIRTGRPRGWRPLPRLPAHRSRVPGDSP